jgi:hypothetical protein
MRVQVLPGRTALDQRRTSMASGKKMRELNRIAKEMNVTLIVLPPGAVASAFAVVGTEPHFFEAPALDAIRVEEPKP